jgi:glycosyltransferase involved in cell wall biosynthesis
MKGPTLVDFVQDIARHPMQKSVPNACRLLYVVGQLGLGGLERQLFYLLASLDRARYQPVVVVWNLNTSDKYYLDIEALNIPIHGFPSEWSPVSKLRAFRALARHISPEIIHSYGFPTNFPAYYAAWGTRALPIGSLRGDLDRAKCDGGLIRGALNAHWPSCLIANSVAAAEAARRHSGVSASRQISIVRNGLDLNRFSCSNDTAKPRTYVAAIGSLFPVKRWDRLLKAIKETKGTMAEIVFRIAGDGPLRPDLEKLAGDLGISRRVEFLGVIHDIPSFLNGARFLVHTSESEGCPNAVMEAMACGLPVVAMAAGDIPHLIDDERTGFVIAQDDEETLADRIGLLLQDGSLCVRMGMEARVIAEREFGLQRVVSQTLAAYMAAGWRI